MNGSGCDAHSNPELQHTLQFVPNAPPLTVVKHAVKNWLRINLL